MGYMMSVQQDETIVRQLLDAIALPADVLGYDLRLGEAREGDAAVWITFRTTIPDNAPMPELRSAATRLNEFSEQIQTALIQVLPDRFPYVSFAAGN